MRTRVTLALALVSSLLIAGQAFAVGGQETKGGPKVQDITFWGPFSGPDGELIQKLIERFNKEKPEIKTTFTVVPWDQYYDKLSINVAAGTVPEVSIMHGHYLAGYAAQDVLMALDDAVKRLGFNADDYIPALWSAGVYNGVRYGIPLDTFPRFMWYNKRLLREAGLNAELSKTEPVKGEDLLAMAQKLTKGDQWGFVVPPAGNGVHRTWLSILWQNGGDVLTPDNKKAAVNSPAGVQAIQVMMDLVTKYKTQPAGAVNIQQMLNQSKIAMASDQITELASHLNIAGLELGSAPFPLIGKTKATFAVGHNFVIPKPKKVDQGKVNATLTFVKWISDNSFDYAKVGQVPANLKVIKSDQFKSLEHQWIAAQQWTWFKAPPGVVQMREISDKLLNADLSKAMAGQQSAADAMKNLESAINKLLAP